MQHNCLNCGTILTSNFCPTCGQKSSTHRITFAALLHDIPHSVLHIDKGFFYTFIQLLYRPGKAIADFVNGKRIRYFSPFAYLILLCAISSFFSHWRIGRAHVEITPPTGILFPQVHEFFSHYPAVMFCALTPFISIWSWLFNRHKQYNYWENFILNTYLIAQFNLFFIIKTLLQILHIYTSPNVTLMLICFIGYLSFAYIQFFPQKRTAMNMLINIVMFLIIGFTLLNGLMVIGFMTPWWPR